MRPINNLRPGSEYERRGGGGKGSGMEMKMAMEMGRKMKRRGNK